MGGFTPSLEFLNNCVPLWFALVMAFSTPYMWSRYVKEGAQRLIERYLGGDE